MKYLKIFIVLIINLLSFTLLSGQNISSEWLSRYDGPDHLFDQAYAMTASQGFIYVTGESDSFLGQEDIFVVKYTSDGNPVWSVRYNGPANGVDRGLDIAIDSYGSVYVTGQSWGGTASEYDLVTIKYSSEGTEEWVKRFDGNYHNWERGTGIAVGLTGNVYVTGWSIKGYDINYGYFYEYVTIKYNTNGLQQWLSTYTGPGNVDIDRAYDIAVDLDDNAYVTGSSYSLGNSWDFGTVKYRGSDGYQLWERRYDYGIGGIDEGNSIAINNQNEICVTGLSYTDLYNGQLQDALTIKYDNAGNQIWTARYNGPANSIDAGNDVAIDDAGNVFITGHSIGLGTNSDYLTIKYNLQGQIDWVSRYNGPLNGSDYRMYLAVDPGGNVFVTG